MRTKLKKWGNSTGAIIPAAILNKAGLSMGDSLEMVVEGNEIHLKPTAPEYSLEELLAGSVAQDFARDEEDNAWLQDRPVGRELD